MKQITSLREQRRSGVWTALFLAAAVAAGLTSCIPLDRPASTAPPTAGPPIPAGSGAAAAIPPFSHVFVIVMENREYGQIIGAPDAPYLNQLASTYGLARRYYAITHPSLPNYLALLSGSVQGIANDCPTCEVEAPNLVDQLERHGRTWIAYVEDLPAPCFNGPFAGGPGSVLGTSGYVRRHNPFMYFRDIGRDPSRCQHVVPLTRLDADLASGYLPTLVWITPNLEHDMHSGSTREGDIWLSGLVPRLLASPAWQNGGVLFITWDEGQTNDGCCGNAAGGHVPTLVIAARGRRAFASDQPYTHYSLLRTIEEAWQLGYLGHAADPTTRSMADFFR